MKSKRLNFSIAALLPALWFVFLFSGCFSDIEQGDDSPPSGSLDTTFGGTGFVVNDGGGTGLAIAIDASGRIVVAGYELNSTFDMKLWRYNPDGTIDVTFGSGGIITHHNAAGGNGDDFGQGIAIDSSGRIIVAGWSYNGINDDMTLWRYNSNGTLDTIFGSGGIVIHDNAAGGNGWDMAWAIVIDGSGRIVVAGDSDNGTDSDMALWRYNSGGILDTSFNGTGYATHDNAAGGNGWDTGWAIAIDGSGRIVVAGSSENGTDSDMALWRYGSGGTLDTSFNGTGYTTHGSAAGGNDWDDGEAIAIDGSGRIVVAGWSFNNNPDPDMVLWRYDSGGTPDTTFGSSGIVTHDNAAGGNGSDYGNAIAIDGSGRIVVAGTSFDGTEEDMTLWRYNPDGTLDTTFGSGGIVTHNNAAGGNGGDYGFAIAIDGSGRIVVAGESWGGTDTLMAIWRFNP